MPGDGLLNESSNPSAAATRKGAWSLEAIHSAWTDWVSNHRLGASLIFMGIILCIVLIAVIPPVCVIHGCRRGRRAEVVIEDLPFNRLLVHFDELGKTVKSKVSPLLYDYFDEEVLSFGVNIVTFKTVNVLYEVQRILEAQTDVLILLRDRPQYRAPTKDLYQGLALQEPAIESMPLRLLLQQQQQANTKELGDELAAAQWSLDQVAARGVWNVSQGEKVVVAVIDTGCDMQHPDLKGNFWENPGETPGNGKDDDVNGYVDDFNGYDFPGPCTSSTSGSNCGSKPMPQDTVGHGSHCSGIIGAIRNNGVGITGVSPSVSIMCLKVTPNDGLFYTSQNLKAIDYAIANGAHIISCSFGPSAPLINPTALQQKELQNETGLYSKAIEAIVNKSMLLVAAAGNERTDLDTIEHYNPCTLARNFPKNVLCVMATDDRDRRLDDGKQGSNYGPRTVNLGAPGLKILSTVPKLSNYNYSSWTNLSGSSMATPLVAGVAALIMSILGRKDGNFYRGPQATQILVDYGDTVQGLVDVIGNRRINAREAVQAAMQRRENITHMMPQTNFSESDQFAIMEGFNLTYYSTTQPPGGWTIMDESTSGSVSRIAGYKWNTGKVVIKASMYLRKRGLYLIRVNTSANARDIQVFVGQAQLTNLSETYLIESIGAWYALEISYTNPVEPIDIRMAEPVSKNSTLMLGIMPDVFFVTSDLPPVEFYYAPRIALSSAWQVLTRIQPGKLNTSSILRTALLLNQTYNNSAVVPELNFTAKSTILLRDVLGLAANVTQVVGLAHTRLQAPNDNRMRFMVTCEMCALYVNGLRVLEVYDPRNLLQQPVTQLSSCVYLGSNSALHDLMLRFATVKAASTTALAVTWRRCNDTVDESLRPYLMNNLFWQPSSGVAGYVSGMQCDVWKNALNDKVTKTWEPLVKFRLPTAIAQTEWGSEVNQAKQNDVNQNLLRVFSGSGCSANETIASSNCSAAAAFTLKDLLNKANEIKTTDTIDATLRCWTYVNGGFGNGTLQTVKAMDVNVYLGAQQVLNSDGTTSVFPPSVAPNTTTLGNYYQLLVVEFPSLKYNAVAGICNGSRSCNENVGDLVRIDMSRTLLPIPLLKFGSTTAASRRDRRQLFTANDLESGLETVGLVQDDSKHKRIAYDRGNTEDVTSERNGHHGIVRRVLQLSPATDIPFVPNVLGASTYSDTRSGTGLCGQTFTLNGAFNDGTLRLSTVFYNLTTDLTNPFVGTICTNGSLGLVGPLPSQRNAQNLPCIVQFSGFMRVPISAAPSSSSAAAVAAADTVIMRRWSLRVLDVVNQTTAITVGDVTVSNGVEYPTPITASETVIWLPHSNTPGAAQQDLYLPAVVTARSKTQGVTFNVALLTPDSRAVIAVNRSLWYCREVP